jgi:hypothetical protein
MVVSNGIVSTGRVLIAGTGSAGAAAVESVSADNKPEAEEVTALIAGAGSAGLAAVESVSADNKPEAEEFTALIAGTGSAGAAAVESVSADARSKAAGASLTGSAGRSVICAGGGGLA